jgi:hypothetical protein
MSPNSFVWSNSELAGEGILRIINRTDSLYFGGDHYFSTPCNHL